MEYVGAYLVRGGESALDALLVRLEKEKVIARNSPDLFARAYRSFGVDDAAEVRGRARARPVAGPRRVFALFVPMMTSEAQNALLKTLEEPAADALFFLVTPSPEMVLPTIRSRTQTLDIAAESGAGVVDAAAFLKAEPAKRLEMLKPLYDHEDEGRDIGSVIAFLAALEARFAAAKRASDRAEGLAAVYRARKYAADKGSLLKALLEQVALLAPKI